MASMDHTAAHDDTIARLVTLGRDGDAARLQTARRAATTHRGGNFMDTQQQLELVLPALLEVVGNITPDQLDNPSPCAHFTVRDVLGHMIGGAGFFAAQLRGGGVPTPQPEGIDLTGDDPIATFRAAMDTLGRAAVTPGASTQTVVTPFGDMTGDEALRYLALDGTVHTWDLAQATGQSFTPPDELVAAAMSTAKQTITPAARDGDTFADATPAPTDASSFEQLIAFTGRTI
jgi:uncharacterized protein (TIGR03086 family)